MVKNSFSKCIDFFLKWRYLWGLIAFIVGLSLNLHGSSISNWNNYGVTELTNGQQMKTVNQYSKGDQINILSELKHWVSYPPKSDGTIIGYPRMIRTDEWLVQTPFFISQANTGAKLVNKSYGLSGQNMVISYNAPVKDISVIGKPFNWGFLFLGPTKGLSWYWCSKIILMLLLAFEFSMIITKKNKLLSTIGSFWITYTPAIQWWCMQHLGDVVFYSLAIMVLIHHFFNTKSVIKKIGLVSLLVASIIGFVLVIYPAFQVPFAYLILGFFIIEFVNYLKKKKFHLIDFTLITTTLIASLGVIGWTLYRSSDALKLTLNTLYPGHRESFGGNFPISHFSDLFLSFIIPFKIPSFINQVEASSSIGLLIPILVLIPFLFFMKNLKENYFGIFMSIYTFFLFIYTFVGVPKILAKVTLFTYVTSARSWQALSVISVFASIWLISYLWREKNRIYKWLLLTTSTLLMVGLTWLTSKDLNVIGYIGKKYLIALALLYIVIVAMAIFRQRLVFTILIMGAIIISGFTVNPVVKGMSVITDKKVSTEISKLVKADKEARWVTEGSLYNYPQMFGAKTINSVRFYPDVKLMNQLDPNHKMEKYWNRYSHMQVFLTKDNLTMDSPVPDVLTIHLNESGLSKTKVKYILSYRDLNKEFGNDFKLIYGPDKDGNSIYQYTK